MISRRQLLYFSALVHFCYPLIILKDFVLADDMANPQYPLTLAILKEAYWAERIAGLHYNGYCRKALTEHYPNIAYLFSALAISEKIHAENYQNLILSMGSVTGVKKFPVFLATTKKNLNMAAQKELEKINEFYPEILKRLSSESHDQAVINCMYSWKSHQQHEKIISDIKKFSGFFFGSLAKRIESMDPDYYVCEICGSTIDAPPTTPCEICNHPLSHYQKLDRPALSAQ